MVDLIVVGSLSVDLVLEVPRCPGKGETIIGSKFSTFVGGKGNNQALAASRAGAKVAMVGRIGKDNFGDRVFASLQKEGINTEHLKRDPEADTGIADIFIDANGDNYIAIAPQANSRLCPQDIEEAEELISNAKLMLIQLEIPLATVEAAAKMARKHGLRVLLNPAPAPDSGKFSEEILNNIDMLIPNQSEAAILTGIEVNDLKSGLDAGAKLKSLGLKDLIITMGEMGALVLPQNAGPQMIPAFNVEVVDTTAAGDAFCGALAAGLAKDLNLSDSLKFACAAGALATTRLGAEPSLPLKADIDLLVKSIYSQSMG